MYISYGFKQEHMTFRLRRSEQHAGVRWFRWACICMMRPKMTYIKSDSNGYMHQLVSGET